MKSLVTSLTALSLIFGSVAYAEEDILQLSQQYRNETYNLAQGEEDIWFTTESSSMFAWGIGITALIAVLVALIPQSKESSSTNGNVNPCDPCGDLR